jgi:hypothetical protein
MMKMNAVHSENENPGADSPKKIRYRRGTMKQIAYCLICGFMFFASLFQPARAEEKAMPEDIIKKIREASEFLSRTKEAGLETFNERKGRWVFKDTYIFVFDCDRGRIMAHPINPKLIGKNLMGLKDFKGNYFFAQLCAASHSNQGGWVEYWWPKVGEDKLYRKISLMVQVPGTSYQVGGGIYDDTVSVGDLEKLLK